MFEIVEITYLTNSKREIKRYFIKLKTGYLPINFLEQVENLQNIISEYIIDIDSKTGQIKRQG